MKTVFESTSFSLLHWSKSFLFFELDLVHKAAINPPLLIADESTESFWFWDDYFYGTLVHEIGRRGLPILIVCKVSNNSLYGSREIAWFQVWIKELLTL